jgi:hypothetical protein
VCADEKQAIQSPHTEVAVKILMTFIERWWLLSPALPFLSPPVCWYAVETFVPPEVIAPPGSDWINIGISFVCLVITCTSRHSSYLQQPPSTFYLTPEHCVLTQCVAESALPTWNSQSGLYDSFITSSPTWPFL